MARMNVRKKMKSSHTFESYWDMLPPEIHTIIIAYKKGQEEIDEQRKKKNEGLVSRGCAVWGTEKKMGDRTYQMYCRGRDMSFLPLSSS